jgi:hypothetical protein
MPTTNEEILKEINKLAESNKRMERVLIGDEAFGVQGICQEVKEIKSYIEHEKISKAKRTGVVIGGAAAASGGTYGVIEWLKSIF